jgi:hypothetical protein
MMSATVVHLREVLPSALASGARGAHAGYCRAPPVCRNPSAAGHRSLNPRSELQHDLRRQHQISG